MNKAIALLCSAILTVSSSATIVIADETDTIETSASENIVDTTAENTGSDDETNVTDVSNSKDSIDTDTDLTNDTVDNLSASEADNDITDNDSANSTGSEAAEQDTASPESTSTDADAVSETEAPTATDAPEDADSSESSAQSAAGAATATTAPDETAVPSVTEEPKSSPDPAATAEPTVSPTPAATAGSASSSDTKTETKTVTVMKKPFSLVKEYDDNPFIDCQSGWFKNYVSFAYANGIIKGYNDNTFDPNGKITGTQLAVMLYRITTGKTDMITEGDLWSDEATAWVKINGIMADFAGEEFDSEDQLTREEIICSLYRAYKLYNDAAEGGKIDTERFPDAGEISDFALPAMQWAVDSKIITGKSDKWIDPLSNVTRAETATIFKRYLENLEFAEIPVEIISTDTSANAVEPIITEDSETNPEADETKSPEANTEQEETKTVTGSAEPAVAAEETVKDEVEPETPAQAMDVEE